MYDPILDISIVPNTGIMIKEDNNHMLNVVPDRRYS